MNAKSLFILFITLVLAACGSESADMSASAADNESASMQQAGFPDGGSGETLVISPRNYTSGTITVKVSGFFEVEGTQTLNAPASLSDEEQTWLQYGVSGAPELNALFTNSQSMAEHGVTVAIGPYSVTTTNTSGECQAEVDVTPTLITGRYTCKGSTGYSNESGQMGEVDVEVEFSARS